MNGGDEERNGPTDGDAGKGWLNNLFYHYDRQHIRNDVSFQEAFLMVWIRLTDFYSGFLASV